MMADLQRMLADIRVGTDYETSDTEHFARAVINPLSTDYWDTEGRAWLFSCTYLVLYRAKEQGQAPDLAVLLQTLCDVVPTCQAMMAFTAPNRPAITQSVVATGKRMINRSRNECTAIVATTQAAFAKALDKKEAA